PQCGHPTDPDATLHPGPPPTPWPAPDFPDMPARLPLAPLVTLAVSCALMGVMLGVWIGWQREVPAQRTEVRLPPLPPSGPAFNRPAAPPQFFPAARPTGLPPLPPARVMPSGGRLAT